MRGKPRILLIYNKAHSTFTAYPWMLAGSGFLDVDVLIPENHVVGFSRWVSRCITYQDDAEMFECLQAASNAVGGYQWIHFVDETSRGLLLSQCSANPELLPCLQFPEGSELFEACGDKVLFQQWCEARSIPVPLSLVAGSGEEVLGCAERIGYPFILKGATGSRGTTVFFIEDECMLKQELRQNASISSWLVQEYINGRVGTTSFVARDGHLYAMSSLYYDVPLGHGFGPVAVARLVHNAKLEKLVRSVVEAGQLSGVSGYDWMENEDGDYKIIDSHLGRGSANTVVSLYQGVDLGHALARSLGEDNQVSVPNQNEQRVWLMPQMFNLLFEGRIQEAWRLGNPLQSGVAVFWFGTGEWRLFLKLSVPLIWGRTRVLLGGVKGRGLRLFSR